MRLSKEQVASICHKVIREHFEKEWQDVDKHEMRIERIFGGCTGALFKCDSSKASPSPLLVRFNHDTEFDGDSDDEGSHSSGCGLKFAGSAAEQLVFHILSDLDFGPKLYSVFANGRIEQYIPSRQLNTNDLITNRFDESIFRKIAFVHQLDIPLPQKDNWILLMFDMYKSKLKTLDPLPDKVANNSEIGPMLKQIRDFDVYQHLKWLLSNLHAINGELVFSHNDITRRNILVLNQNDDNQLPIDKQVMLIDFGDCYYNYRAFDLACYLRCVASDYDMTESNSYQKYVYSSEQKRHLIELYLKESKRSFDVNEVDQLEFEIEFFILLSDLLTIMYMTLSTEKPHRCKNSWKYALERIKFFCWTKQQFLVKHGFRLKNE